ncbi:MAG: right-handed parallel beta-helix repeat-containing protein, partial [Thermoguttaceae bacterium]|nr:right-handed parallel beta-helix repeat-containing protein [Thermoguttaceae bacterium]
TGVYFKCNSPISVNGVGVRVSRNTIHDIPRTPISFTGAKIVIEYNDLRISNLESEDSGAIYSNGAGSWINNHGCTIRGNWVRDSIGFGHKLGKYQFYMFTWGIYLDDTSGGLDVYDNIVQRCTIGCMHLHNARDNQIYNNIFSDGGDRQYQLSAWSNDPNGRMMKRHLTTMVRNYEKAVQCPEWRALRGMDVHPKDAFLPDGSSMSGDHIFNNIFYYPNQPETPYISHRLFNFKYNEIDRNLVWNGGTSPIRTGMTGIQKIVASLNDKVINLDFAKTDAEHFPDHWKWYQKTRPDARAEVIGPKTLRIHEAWNPEKVNVKTATLRNDSLFNLEPGKSYRIRFSYSGEHADAPAAARVVTESKGFWRAMGVTNSIPGKSGTAESVFRVPKPGEDHYDARIGQFAFHLVYYGKTGYIDIGSVQLEEVVPSTEWEAWQQQGIDVHSVVADPEFVDATHDDFTLKPTSPALKLGFKQIDRKKIGVYDDPRRATFPIVEAEGVREHPEWLRIPESKEVRKESK